MTNENESTIFIWLGFRKGIYMAVSYTHLTLPTIDDV